MWVITLIHDVIKLITVTQTTNANGFPVNAETERQVFAQVKSVRQNEFYQANQVGLQLQIMFVIRAIEYNNEQYLSYKNKDYKIIRTYQTDSEMIELVCADRKGEIYG